MGGEDIAQTGPLSEALAKAYAAGGQPLEDKMNRFTKLLDAAYSANILFTGISATKTEGGGLGGREVMVQPNTAQMELSRDNHRSISLGVLTRADVDAWFAVHPVVAP